MEETTTNNITAISSLFYSLVSVERNLTWLMMIFLIFGNIGNLCNCLVFLQKSLRSNPCSRYLLVSSIINVIVLTYAIPTGIYGIEQTDPVTYSLIYCKLRLYIYHTLLMISRYLIILACLDRACLSSRKVSVRNFSQIRIARLLSLIIIPFWFIAAMHLPLISTIVSGYCIMPGIYSLIYGIYALIFAGLIPPVLMSIFSLMTLRNLHSIHTRVHPTQNPNYRSMRQRDFHLTRMLMGQVIVYVLTTTPYPINAFYSAVTISVNKDINRQMIESFIYFITGTFLLFINPSISFYIYITTSKAFRTELKAASINLWQQVFHRNQIPNVNFRFVERTIARQHAGFQRSSSTTARPNYNK
jgi:hypothetical protein